MSNHREHHYHITTTWTGNLGEGTRSYRSFSRDHDMEAKGKPVIRGSSDPAFRGDAGRYNPEDLLVASVSSCHMLWYLHLCASNKLVVIDYVDNANGTMTEDDSGSGRFTEICLQPKVTFAAPCDPALAARLHEEAHHMCFIANSVNFPVHCQPEIVIAP